MDNSGPSQFQEQAAKIKEDFAKSSRDLLDKPEFKAVENLRIDFLGRKGKLTALMDTLRQVPKEQKPEAGKILNTLRQEIEAQLVSLKQKSHEYLLASKLASRPVDVTLPANDQMGSLHPISLMRRILLREFRRMGFTVYDGPELDLDFYNFSALNFPPHHPARDMQDTFFVDGWSDVLMRTHTSNIQIHAMLNERPPLRIVAPGRVFRTDSDLTHTPMFHQIEGFVVDTDISFAHLKGTMDQFLRAVYGQNLTTRFRPSYFPFVEPGAEMDIQCGSCQGKGCRVCKQTGWVEIGGCGMIHPNVFEAVGFDSEQYTGFAFGFGLDRMAMSKFGVNDLRALFSGHVGFLSQFPSV